jgi:Contractile injection system tube protein
MPLDALRTQPARVSLVNLTTREQLDGFCNPEKLSEKLAANWNRLTPPSLGYQVLQFGSTSNRQLPSVELLFNRFDMGPDAPSVDAVRAFLEALVKPAMPSSSPPHVLFVWPALLSIEAIVSSVDLEYRQFASDGSPLVFAATIALEEVLEARVSGGGS